MPEEPLYEVYALKFGENPIATRGDYFYGSAAEHPTGKVDSSYFVWLIRSQEREVVVDTGFTPEVAEERGRDYLRTPEEALTSLGTDCDDVPLVVLSHLHYDHAGFTEPFTSARFVVQDEEMAFWTGRHLGRREFRLLVELEDIQTLLARNHEGRVAFVDGDREILPGISVHLVGGHTPGLQVVRVRTERGHVVLAADAAHLYEHYEQDAPAGFVTDLRGMYRSFDRLDRLADRQELVVPGHDPTVLDRFERVDGQDGLTVRIA